jgi:hypothetical protein
MLPSTRRDLGVEHCFARSVNEADGMQMRRSNTLPCAAPMVSSSKANQTTLPTGNLVEYPFKKVPWRFRERRFVSPVFLRTQRR